MENNNTAPPGKNYDRIVSLPQDITRIILKNGKININQPPINTGSGLLQILNYHKLIDSSWSYTLLVFLGVIVTSLFIFGTTYWLICYVHGDFEQIHLPNMQKQNNFTPCIYHIHNYASCILFSIETQYKVAYGIKATTDECPEVIFVNAVECLVGLVIQGFMSVIIFSKMAMPKLRCNTLLFSKQALLTSKDGVLYFMFRIGDLRRNHIFNVNCRAVYIATIKTREGDIVRNEQTLLKLQSDGCKNSMFFNWPLVMSHKIDVESPLFDFAKGNSNSHFEIVIVLEGIIQSTGQMTQDRTSYTPDDIIWGVQFENMTKFIEEKNAFEFDFSRFHKIESEVIK